MSKFYDEIKNLSTLAAEDQPSLDNMLRNAIRNSAMMGKTEEVFNLKEHKILTAAEVLDLASLVEEGFKIEVKLDLAAQAYPSLSIFVKWGDK